MKLNQSWLMVLCVVGMGAIFILPALGIGLGSLFGFLLVLLCPLSHLLMTRGMGGQGGSCHGPVAEQEASQKAPPPPVEARSPAAIGDGK